MATKKITPKNPTKESSKEKDEKAAERKTATSHVRFRKTSALKYGGH